MYKTASFLTASLLVGCSSTTNVENKIPATYEISGSWECEAVGDKIIELSYRDDVVYKDDSSFSKLSKMNFRLPNSDDIYWVKVSSNGTWEKNRNNLTEKNMQFTVVVDDKFPEAYVEQFKSEVTLPEKSIWALKLLEDGTIRKKSRHGQELICHSVLR
ncbi:hypothetical protein ACQKQC_09915 [Vibrio fortis]|jgi:hypothetical protein|uniref:hypothetical protein n=1 Tax=Vibrio fortis TaxID=212667 RepID=UPI004068121E